MAAPTCTLQLCLVAAHLIVVVSHVADSRCLFQAASSQPGSGAEQVPPANTTKPSPERLSRIYSAQGFAGNTNFSFWPGYDIRATGSPGERSFSVQPVNNTTGRNISAWHDIPPGLDPSDNTIWVLVEIPQGERAKYETQTSAAGNPIAQDTDAVVNKTTNETSLVLRYYLYGGSRGNYGGIPQTWENSNRTDNTTGFPGDDDPVDFLDIGTARAPIGGVYRAKVLGALSMIDKNETDWKVVVINARDPRAQQWQDIKDVPQATRAYIYDFYQNYKQAEKKPAARFFPFNATSTDAHWYGANLTLQSVLQARLADHALLLSGGCKSEDCKDLCWAGKPAGPEEGRKQPGVAGW